MQTEIQMMLQTVEGIKDKTGKYSILRIMLEQYLIRTQTTDLSEYLSTVRINHGPTT